MTELFAPALAGILGLLLLYAAWGDIRARIIPNELNAAIALLAIPWWWANGWMGWPDIAWQVGAAVAVFAIFVGLFALGVMGGGDVKMIGAIALWLPLAPLGRMLVVMAIAGGALTLLMLILHRRAKKPGQPEIPYGVAIAIGTAWVMANDVLTISGS